MARNKSVLKIWRNLRKQRLEHSTTRAGDYNEPSSKSLERELRGWQVFMIAISGIIGVTIFATNGEFLRTAGPSGLMTAIAFVGITAICVTEGLSELVVLWPVSNAMVRFVHTFVDEELALVVGIAYWYAWASIIATMFIVAANFTEYWDLATFWQTLVFYVLGPVVILGINWMGVKAYGWVEGIAGILKLIFVFAGAIFLFVIGAKHGSAYVNDGYQVDKDVATNTYVAVVLVIPYLTYGFLGVEIVSVTAFEAKSPRKSLKYPSMLIAWVIVVLFVLCGLGEALNIAWDDPELPDMADHHSRLVVNKSSSLPKSFSILVLAARHAGLPRFASFLNGCLVFSCLSAANTALYVASRTMYGLCRELKQDDEKRIKRGIAMLGALHPQTRVPHWALVVSVVSFFWLPFLHLRRGYSIQSLLTIMITVGSVGCVLVWASQCLAFIRYHYWLRQHKAYLDRLIERYPKYRKYDRWTKRTHDRYISILSPLQPAPAYLGLLMCFLIVFVFSSAIWWNGEVTAKKVAAAYAGPAGCALLWLFFKLLRYRKDKTFDFGVDLSQNQPRFLEIINDFEIRMFLRDENESEPENLPNGSRSDSDRASRSRIGIISEVGIGGNAIALSERNELQDSLPKSGVVAESVVGAGTHTTAAEASFFTYKESLDV